MSECDSCICFGAYRVNPATTELFRGRKKIPIQQKPFRILLILLQRHGESVSRAELCASLWPDTNVELDLCLNTAIHKLRVALGDDATVPRFIQTLGVNGYRFIGRLRLAKTQTEAQESSPSQLRLAVIPFEDLKNEGGEYFAYSMTEQIIARLGNSKQFRVFAPPSIMHYKHAPKTAPQLCRELRADYLLCGSVLRDGGRFRLYVRLLKGRDQNCLWANGYAADEEDVFKAQDAIAEEVLTEVSRTLGLQRSAVVLDGELAQARAENAPESLESASSLVEEVVNSGSLEPVKP